MGDKTGIQWTDSTWNPVHGCSKVSPGCAHCYAETLSLRYKHTLKPWTPENASENVKLQHHLLGLPLRWRRPRRIFVNSMSDLFHEQVPDEFIEKVFGVMLSADQHIFQVLTKRPERMRDFMLERTDSRWASTAFEWPAPNIWLGTSVENQHFADERIPLLLDTPAAVRFLSCEPLLGPIQFAEGWLTGFCDATCDHFFKTGGCRCSRGMGNSKFGPWPRLHWVITGGESGAHHRPFIPAWAASVRDQCLAAGVAYFHKQGSGQRPGMHQELDGRLWHEFPKVEVDA
jgi:protein gp37